MRDWLQRYLPLYSPDDLSPDGDDQGVTDTGGTSDAVIDDGAGSGDLGGAEPPAPEKIPTIRESVKAALTEVKAKDPETPEGKAALAKAAKAPKTPKTPAQAAAPKPGAAPAAPKSPTDQAAAQIDPAKKPAVEPPTSWSAEEKALWSSMPDGVKSAVIRHDQNTAKGVAELKARYQPFETAIAPYREAIKLFRGAQGQQINEGQAITQLFAWQQALANPNKERAAQAFVALAQSHGLDIATLAGAPQAQPNAQDTASEIPPALIPILQAITSKLAGFEQQTASQLTAAAQSTVMGWAKDKPHFDQVRGLMKQLAESGIVPLTPNGHIDLDACYEKACQLHPEVSASIAQGKDAAAANAAAEASAKAAADKAAKIAAARKAGTSIRPGAPPSTAPNGALPATGRPESARESIKRALRELSA